MISLLLQYYSSLLFPQIIVIIRRPRPSGFTISQWWPKGHGISVERNSEKDQCAQDRRKQGAATCRFDPLIAYAPCSVPSDEQSFFLHRTHAMVAFKLRKGWLCIRAASVRAVRLAQYYIAPALYRRLVVVPGLPYGV
jgi:hypothetical protein